MNEQTHTANETISSEETNKEVGTNINAEQNASEKSGSTSGEAKPEQVDNFSQMYDMLKERDTTIDNLKKEVAELKKTNTTLLLKVNASATPDAQIKDPYEKFIDSMVAR